MVPARLGRGEELLHRLHHRGQQRRQSSQWIRRVGRRPLCRLQVLPEGCRLVSLTITLGITLAAALSLALALALALTLLPARFDSRLVRVQNRLQQLHHRRAQVQQAARVATPPPRTQLGLGVR